jgi:hypothetical protein
VRIVAELAQHPHARYHPKPEQAAHDRGVWMRGDLRVHEVQHRHRGGHHLAVGGLDRLGRSQLRHRQRSVQCHHSHLQAALSARTHQRLPDDRWSEPAARLRGRCQLQHRQRLRLGEFRAERGQRARVQLPQRAAQRIDAPLPGPDQAWLSVDHQYTLDESFS